MCFLSSKQAVDHSREQFLAFLYYSQAHFGLMASSLAFLLVMECEQVMCLQCGFQGIYVNMEQSLAGLTPLLFPGVV